MMTLVLETSTPRGGVSIFRGDELEFAGDFTADRSHSSELFTVIERALGADAQPDRIAVGLGPGSYAGVRIAISAAIGLAVAGGGEMIGLPSILALEDGEYLAVGDARRGAYWLAHVRDGELIEGPILVTREELGNRVAGAGAPVFSSEELGIAGVEMRFPSVTRLGELAAAGRGICARGALEPLYLREPHITYPK